ncbi:uncharacterized protein LOC129939656 [Eupeodes corollae]|uniref:uncharacterized protein LOC129939656 n=1 Tax=Eupeodes corollae TaxID=290404 RepID=UPI0024917BFD|nr:uncharacterized protein LOC129939656 [Eupeodes corollae]
MPSFITSEMEKANKKFIELVKKYPCIWNRDSENYNHKPQMDEAWHEISKEMGDTPKTCLIHWQKIRRAYARSFRINANGTFQKSEYYMSSSLEFVRPHLKLGCQINNADSGGEGGSSNNKKYTSDADDSRTSTTDIEIKEEPLDSDEDVKPLDNAEKVLFEIIKMEDEDDDEEDQKFEVISIELSNSPSPNKRKRETDSNEENETIDPKEKVKNDLPNLSLIEANRKFFESLIPFIDDMNTQQNRRFRREIMCLVDDVLDDRDIDGTNSSC